MIDFIKWAILGLAILLGVGAIFMEVWVTAYEEGFKDGVAHGKKKQAN